MNEIEKRFRNRIVLIVGGGGVALLLLAWGLVKGVLQGRTVAIAGAMLWIAMSVAILIKFACTEERKQNTGRPWLPAAWILLHWIASEATKNVRALKKGIVFMALLLPWFCGRPEACPLSLESPVWPPI